MSPAPTDTQFVTVDGLRTAYSRAGSGPAVVLLHGIPTSRLLWRGVAPRLAAAGFEVIAVDLLGYGGSDQPTDADLGIAAQARRLAGVLDALGWHQGSVVGHDIGGGVAQLFALAQPERVSDLVLIDTIAYDSFPEPGIARLKEPAWDAILGAPDFDLKKGLSKGFARGLVRTRPTPELIDAYALPFAGVEGRLSYLRAARALRTEELASKAAAIERLTIPTLVLWGADDVFQPIAYGRRLAAAMPNASFATITPGGHFLPEDAPDETAQTIANFVRRRLAVRGDMAM